MTLDSPPGYSLRERDRRLAVAREVLAAENCDAMLVYGEREGTGPAPFAFDVLFTNDRPGSIVVIPSEGEPSALVPLPMYVADHFEARQRGEEPWIAPQHVEFARFPAMIAQTLERAGLDKARIGVVGLEPYPPFYFLPPYPHALLAGLAEALPGAEFVPVGHRLLLALMPNSEEELAVVRFAAAVGDEMVDAMVAAARPDASEADVYAAGLDVAHRRGVAAPGMILMSGRPGIGWGPPPWTYRPQRPRAIAPGDVLLGEVFTAYGMKETQHQITITVGEPPRDMARAADAARASYEAGLAALRVGARFGDVAEAMRAPVLEAGGRFVHPVVHGLNPLGTVSGVRLAIAAAAPAAGYRDVPPIPDVLADLPIQAGMTFAFEPNCHVDGQTVNLGGTVIAVADGPEELNPRTATVIVAT